MFKFEEDIIEEVSKETGVSVEEVERIWKHNMHFMAKCLKDPKAPKFLLNGWFTIKPDKRLTENQIIEYMHKLRNTLNEDLRQHYKERINDLMKVRRRIISEKNRNKKNG